MPEKGIDKSYRLITHVVQVCISQTCFDILVLWSAAVYGCLQSCAYSFFIGPGPTIGSVVTSNASAADNNVPLYAGRKYQNCV